MVLSIGGIITHDSSCTSYRFNNQLHIKRNYIIKSLEYLFIDRETNNSLGDRSLGRRCGEKTLQGHKPY